MVTAAPPATDEGLKRKLIPRQIAMMAMGSAIGVGLLLGSTVTIRLAGPGGIVTGVFGELEYWFASIKVAAILAFIAAGLVVIAGVGGRPAVGIRHLTDDPGGFLPNGWRGVWLALTLVITSYMGIEGIAVTAGEAQDPETSIPRAMRTMVLRLILFYVLAILVMLMITPWRQLAEGGGTVTASPFVRAFAAIGIPSAAGAVDIVVISGGGSGAHP